MLDRAIDLLHEIRLRARLIEKLHELRLLLTYSNRPNKETPSNDNLSHKLREYPEEGRDTRRRHSVQVLIKPLWKLDWRK